MKIIKKIDLNVKHIAHIADIHIRNVKRHIEYEEVFEKLYSELRTLKESHRDFVIYLGGDIVHTKLDMSPELISVTYKFLKSCADIAPTLLILGNHDCNLNNKSRLDALTPIVESLNHPNLFFLKDTGVYRTNTVDFIVWSILDEHKNYIVPPKGKNKQILFYHGAIDTAATDQGFKIKNNKVNLEKISEFDYVMLGDIHKYQYLNENKTIAYCGSTVQQNFGESLYHGFLLWNIETGFSKFIELHNNYGFYTLEVNRGKWIKESMPASFCSNPSIRIKVHDTTQSDITKLVTGLKTNANISEIKIQKIPSKTDLITTKTVKTGDIRDVEYQNQLILSYLQKTYAIDSELKNQLISINRELNTNIDISKTIKNISWIPIKFEFSNMFSYGVGNEINFDSMEGIYGLFASNAAGKSSILDALMFCIFDKCSRTFKAGQVLNNKMDAFTCNFEFQIHGKSYFIDRVGIKDKKDHVKVDVNFYTYENGTQVLLNGTNREETNSIIREYLGNYDEFILTTLSLQNNNSNFVDKAQRERKDLLSQFLDLNVFEDLNQLATSELNQLKAVIKEFSKQDYPTKIANALADKKNSNKLLKEYTDKKNNLLIQSNKLSDEILELSKMLKPINNDILLFDLNELNNQIFDINDKIQKSNEKIQELSAKKSDLQSKLDGYTLELNNRDEMLLIKNAEYEEKYKNEISTLIYSLEKNTIKIKNNKEKVQLLDAHQYDPNCQYCIENQFVKDALFAKKELVDLLKIQTNIEDNINRAKKQLEKYAGSIADLSEYNGYKNEILSLSGKISELDNKIKEFSIFQLNANNSISDINGKIKSYNDHKDYIEFNKSINSKIDEKQLTRKDITDDMRQIEDLIATHSAQVKIAEKLLKDAKENVEKLEIFEQKYKAYEFYTKATNRNGVPYDIISEILPQIETEANEILSYLVDFKIILDTDGKSINIYIMYDDAKIWALELASGMEKFISSIAIRNAMLSYSNLPRPNFIAIDEGFGVLDSENMASLYTIFQYLKTQYKFILVISHIDALKDMAENQIEIYKDNGFSKVIF